MEDLDAPAEPAPAPAIRLRRRVDWSIILILAIVLAVGAYLRFTGLNWDQNRHQHPDERFITMTAEDIRPVESLAEYFDTENSTLNPLKMGSYTYGMLPLFLVRSVAERLDMTHYDKVVLVGRALSGVFDLAAVWLLYLLGLKLYNRRVGLLAAALAAAAVLPIQLSHYLAVDSFSTVFIIGAFLLALKAVPIHIPDQRPRWAGLPWFALFGLAVGMAMACKVNTAPVFGLIGIAGGAHLVTVWKKPAERKSAIKVILVGWVLALLTTALAFRIFQPYAFAGPGFFGLQLNQRWINVISEVTNQVAGKSEWPPNHHWTQRGVTYAWMNMVVWGLGLPLGLAAWAGWGWAGWRIWKGDWRRHLLPFIWVGAYFLWQNVQFWRYMRYFIPIYPIIILLGAWALLELFERTRQQRARLMELVRQGALRLVDLRPLWPGILSTLALAVVVGGTYLYAFVFIRIYQEPITRITASRWMVENIPAPVNVIASTASGDVQYPISVQLNRALNNGEQGRESFTAKYGGVTEKISMPYPSLTSADIHLWLRKGTGSGEIISEGHLVLPASSSSGEQLIDMREAQLEAGETYNLRAVVYTSGSFITTGAVLRSEKDDAPAVALNLDLDAGEKHYIDRSIIFKPVEDVQINRLVIADLQSVPASGETTIQVKLSSDKDGYDVLGEAARSVDLLGEAGGNPIEFSFPPANLSRGATYYVTYKILSGGPLVLEGGSFALETSWDDALPLGVDGYSPLGGMYDPLNLELYEPDSQAKLERMASILDKVDYLVLPSNRAYDAMPRLPLRYPLTLRYYQALFNCVCSGDAMEARANGLQPPYKSPLGFELAAAFEHPFNFGLFKVSDLSADEAFTVYDHPKVMIFKKSADYSSENVRAILGSVDLTQIIDQGPMAFTDMPTGLRLPADRLAAQKSGGTWSKLFDRQSLLNRNQALGAAAWYLLIAVIGWLAFPILFSIFPGLKDRGYGLARLAGLLFIAWLAWVLASLKLAAFSSLMLWACFAILALIGYYFAARHWGELKAHLRANWRSLLGVEALFLALFIAGVLVRLGNPDLWNPWLGGEKPMDFAFFNAVLKSVYFPPEHPWFAGNYINYYYYGYVVAAVPTRLLGILPSIAFNLILPAWFAFTGAGIFSAAFNLVSGRQTSGPAAAAESIPWRGWRKFLPGKAAAAGLAAVGLMLLLGNLYQVRQLYKYLPEVAGQPVDTSTSSGRLTAALSGAGKVLSGEAELPGDKGRWYFGPSRPILHDGPDTPIAEFPLFTFLYGDLHPHLLAMPVMLAALGWILAWLFRPGGKQPWQERAAFWLAGGLIIGMLKPAHTWDYPTLLALACAALVWDGLRRQTGWSRQGIVLLLARPAALAFLSILLYQPFNQWFGTAYSSLEIWKGARTPLGDYLTVHGIFLFVMVSYLMLLSAPRLQAGWQKVKEAPLKSLFSMRWDSVLLIIAVLVAAGGLWLAKYQVMVIGVPLLAWLALLIFKKGRSLDEIIILALFAAGLGATLIVEIVVLKGDVGRSNMLFRYYNQAWAFFSLASAGALAALFGKMRNWRLAGRIAWMVPLALLAAGGLLYPITAVPMKIADRWPGIANPPHTLDGAAFMLGEAGQSMDAVSKPAVYDDEGRQINLASDYAGIKFLQENAVGTPVIVEGQTVEYRWGSRYSIYTGLPTVVGWSWHVRQHNSILPGSLVEKRIQEVVNFYSTPDVEAAMIFLNRYDVQYIVVGDLERGYYPLEGLDKFPRMVESGLLLEAFSQNTGSSQLTIYQMVE